MSLEPSVRFLVKGHGVLAEEHHHMGVNMVASFSCVLVPFEVVRDKGFNAELPVQETMWNLRYKDWVRLHGKGRSASATNLYLSFLSSGYLMLVSKLVLKALHVVPACMAAPFLVTARMLVNS